jgi:hypothetical protein
LLKLAIKNKLDREQMARDLEQISRKGQAVAKVLRKYGRESTGSGEQPETAKSGTSNGLLGSDGEIRRRGLRDDGRPFREDADRFARLRQTSLATADSGAAASLTKAQLNKLSRAAMSDDETAFARAGEAVSQTDESAPPRPPRRNLFKYIYEGRGKDATPKKEIIVNFCRSGLLTGLRTHLSFNGTTFFQTWK